MTLTLTYSLFILDKNISNTCKGSVINIKKIDTILFYIFALCDNDSDSDYDGNNANNDNNSNNNNNNNKQ